MPIVTAAHFNTVQNHSFMHKAYTFICRAVKKFKSRNP
nr:MAG TPA: hypothetical protein [Caudoviricetes sp.]